MSITIQPTTSGPFWQDKDGRYYVRAEVMEQRLRTQQDLTSAHTGPMQVAIKQARIDAAWEKQRGDRYRARALALVKQARRLRAACVRAALRCVLLRDECNDTHDTLRRTRELLDTAQRERAAADKLRMEALQEAERHKAKRDAALDVVEALKLRVVELEREVQEVERLKAFIAQHSYAFPQAADAPKPECRFCVGTGGEHTEHCPFGVPRL
jgi:hypothetical protein